MSAVANANSSISNSSVVESVLIQGDLSKLTPEQRIAYYKEVCSSLGLNHLTQPLEYISFQGKLKLYARRDCAEQLRKINGISVVITDRRLEEGLYIVTAKATDKNGRCDESVGAVSLDNLKGEARANAIMKCETKAKRRVTLSICGLGFLDETEVETCVDMGLAQVPQLPKITNSQMKKIGELLSRFPKDQRKEMVEKILDKKLASASDLTQQEADSVIEFLSSDNGETDKPSEKQIEEGVKDFSEFVTELASSYVGNPMKGV